MEIRRFSPAQVVAVDSLQYQLKLPDGAPRHILEKIVWHKETEVEQMRAKVSLRQLQDRIAQIPAPLNFLSALQTSPDPVSLIAEVKKASPSKGVLRPDFDPVAIAQAYARGGASCLSVLTDREFFQGSGDYLTQIRAEVNLPILCKEFILYPYQIFWARSLGADAVLLIAAILNDNDLQYCLKVIRKLGMTALVEVHTEVELVRVLQLERVDLIGINNRDLSTFSVDLKTTQQLLERHGSTLKERAITVVSESGIFTAADLIHLQGWGVRSVLVGEALVKQPDPAEAVQLLLKGGA